MLIIINYVFTGSLGILPKNENKGEDMVAIMDHFHQYDSGSVLYCYSTIITLMNILVYNKGSLTHREHSYNYTKLRVTSRCYNYRYGSSPI